jgi:hypothetical protein
VKCQGGSPEQAVLRLAVAMGYHGDPARRPVMSPHFSTWLDSGGKVFLRFDANVRKSSQRTKKSLRIFVCPQN